MEALFIASIPINFPEEHMSGDKTRLVKGLVIGFVAGAVAGAITALLTAPKSGKEFRSDIKKKAEDLKDRAMDSAQYAGEKASEFVKATSSAASSAVSGQAESLIEDADKVLTDIRGRASEESARVRSAFRAGVDAYQAEKARPRST